MKKSCESGANCIEVGLCRIMSKSDWAHITHVESEMAVAMAKRLSLLIMTRVRLGTSGQ